MLVIGGLLFAILPRSDPTRPGASICAESLFGRGRRSVERAGFDEQRPRRMIVKWPYHYKWFR